MDCVPIQLDTLHIREAMKSATQDELASYRLHGRRPASRHTLIRILLSKNQNLT